MLKTLNVINICDKNESADLIFKDILKSKNNYHRLYELTSFQNIDINKNVQDLFNESYFKSYNDLKKVIEIINILKYNLHDNTPSVNNSTLINCFFNAIVNNFNEKLITDINNCFFKNKNDILILFEFIKLDTNLINRNMMVSNLIKLIEFKQQKFLIINLIQFDQNYKKFIEKVNYNETVVIKHFIPFYMKMLNSLIVSDFNTTLKIINKIQLYNKLNILTTEHKTNFVSLLFDNLVVDNFKNNILGQNLVIIFKIIKNIDTRSNDMSSIISKYYNLLLKDNDYLLIYIMKSITYFIQNENADEAQILIYAQKYNNNKDEFFKMYEKELIQRSIKSNSKEFIDIEKTIINFIDSETIYDTNILKKCLFDMEFSYQITNDIKKLNINNKTFKDINYDLNKIDIFVGSNLLWNESDSEMKIKDPKLNIYFEIFKKFYKRKFPKRLINFSSKNSFVVLSLDQCNLKVPVEYYDLLQFISQYSNFSLDVLAKEINMDIGRVKEIMKHLKFKKIINSDFTLNMDTFNFRKNINLCKIENINIDEVLEEVHFDRSHSTNCHIIKILKNSEALSNENLFNKVKEKVSKWFELNNILFEKCIKKLINRDIITLEKDLYSYVI